MMNQSRDSMNRNFAPPNNFPLESDFCAINSLSDSVEHNNIKHELDSTDHSVGRLSSSPNYLFSGVDHPMGDPNASNITRTRRRKVFSTETSRLCVVCGETASGYNFDRLTCESCKAFFRRNAKKPRDQIKPCGRGGGCIVEGSQRKHCPSCRLQKCFVVAPEKLEQRAKPRRRKTNSPQPPSHAGLSPQPIQQFDEGDLLSIAAEPSPSVLFAPYASASSSFHPHQQRNNKRARHQHQDPPQGMIFNSTDVATRDFNSSTLPSGPTTMQQQPLYHQPSDLPPSHLINNGPSAVERLAMETDQVCRRHLAQGGLLPAMKLSSSPPPLSHSSEPCRSAGASDSASGSKRRFSRVSRQPPPPQAFATTSPHALFDPGEEKLNLTELDPIRDCIARIREPFGPDEQISTENDNERTLEQEYNRMDVCVRRIVRVVKVLPHFTEISKPLQLELLRINLYGLVILYSSFFYDRLGNQLSYPCLPSATDASNGSGVSTMINLPLLDEDLLDQEQDQEDDANEEPTTSHSQFIQFRRNLSAIYSNLDELTNRDDVVRTCLLAIKFFTLDGLPMPPALGVEGDTSVSESDQDRVKSVRKSYCLFLWMYLRFALGRDHVSHATDIYSRLLVSMTSLRSLELRMTEFAHHLNHDDLSPLMREVCTLRNFCG